MLTFKVNGIIVDAVARPRLREVNQVLGDLSE